LPVPKPDAPSLDTLIYKIIKAVFCLIGLFPRKTAVRIANAMGHIWFLVDKRHQNVAIKNLTHVFGHEKDQIEIRSLARQVFNNLVLILFEIGWSMRLRKKDFFKTFRIYGLHHLEAAHKKGSGVLILTGHMGNWELISMVTGMLGYSMSAIYRPFDFKPLDQFFIDLRGRYGTKLYPRAHAMRKILRSLKDRELIGILLDQNAHYDAGVFVNFFNRPACTNKGLALLALGKKIPVLPVFLIREEQKFRVEIGPEIPVIKTGNKEKDIEANTREYNKVLESIILKYPDQWFWVHRRWKNKPLNPL